MKSVLISIQPKWVEKICHKVGFVKDFSRYPAIKDIYEKTIEVRKTKPKLEVPFKCYIYCTKGKMELPVERKINRELEDLCDGYEILYWANGKVIGEFTCDKIDNYECELWNDEAYELIRQFNYDEYGEIEYEYGAENNENCEMLNKACLTWQDIRKYLGQGLNNCYAWHITDLKIYNTPKDISEFVKSYVDYNKPVKDWCHNDCLICDEENCKYDRRLTRPPQSWCYVETL